MRKVLVILGLIGAISFCFLQKGIKVIAQEDLDLTPTPVAVKEEPIYTCLLYTSPSPRD